MRIKEIQGRQISDVDSARRILINVYSSTHSNFGKEIILLVKHKVTSQKSIIHIAVLFRTDTESSPLDLKANRSELDKNKIIKLHNQVHYTKSRSCQAESTLPRG